jgi:hypothetical protein
MFADPSGGLFALLTAWQLQSVERFGLSALDLDALGPHTFAFFTTVKTAR